MLFENMSLYEASLEANKDYKNGRAIYYQGTKITYRKFFKLVERVADILVNNLNIQKGDVILVAQPNIPDTLVLIYALNKIGAITNLVHPFTPFNQIRAIIKKTNSKYAFLFEQRIAKEVEKYRDLASIIYVTRIEDYLPLFKKFVYHTFLNKDIRKKLGRFRGKFKGFNYLHDLKPTGKKVPTVRGNNKDTSILLHSGSTTGAPKTICLNNSNFNYIVSYASDYVSMPRKDLRGGGMVSFLPSFHGFGFCMTMHMALTNCFACILMPKFSAKELAKIMKKTPVTLMCGVPTAFENLLKCKEFVNSKKLKNFKVCFCGGDSLNIDIKKQFDEVMAKAGSTCKVYEGYGLTEAVAVNVINSPEHHKDGSIGRAIPEAKVVIMSDEGKILAPYEVGEISIKSPAIMNGYLNDLDATKKTFYDGYLLTGDLGYIDDEGYIFFKQRKKRVIKVSGVGVFPTEIEQLVDHIPGVHGCCAIRIPDARLQSAVKLFVVADYFDEEEMKENILSTCRKYLIRWAVPKEIEFIKELPLTPLNKMDFKKLQDLENEKRGISNEK